MTWLNPGCSEPRAPVAECILSVLLCVACVSVWSWSALQFALQDLKIALANTPSVHPLFILYCIVYYKRERVCVYVCIFWLSIVVEWRLCHMALWWCVVVTRVHSHSGTVCSW